MGYLFRAKRWGYDNIATGSATGEERHSASGITHDANATSVIRERLITSAEGSTGQTSNGELYVAGNSSDNTFTRMGVNAATSPLTGIAPDVPGATSNTSTWTSGTSFSTQVFPERVG